MRGSRVILTAVFCVLPACSHGSPSTRAVTEPLPPDWAPQQTVLWGPAPPGLPPGAEFAVLQGDPTKAEPFTVRIRFPNGYRIPPHTHPTTENFTVLSGTFYTGMGARFVESELHPNGHNDFASFPAGRAHFAMARGVTIVQVNAIGPFVLTYVNPDGTPVAQ